MALEHGIGSPHERDGIEIVKLEMLLHCIDIAHLVHDILPVGSMDFGCHASRNAIAINSTQR
jgi:hypothetical protein